MKTTKKLKIFFITNNFTPYSGGVVSSIMASTEALRMAGHDVFIIALDLLTRREKILRRDPPYVIRIPCSIRFTYKGKRVAIPIFPHAEILKLVEKLRPDVIHTHHPFLLGQAALSVARRLSIPIVFTYHTLYEHYAHYFYCPKFIAQWVTRNYVTKFCNSVDMVIVPSNAVREHIVKQGVTKPIMVIPSALRSMFIHENRPFKQKHTADPFRLLLVTRLEKEKNIPFILDAFKLLPKYGFKLIIIGSGSEYQRLNTYAYDKLELSQARVLFFMESVERDLVEFYRSADLFLFPSVTDTQGLVLAESMACGTPVISIDGPGQRDIIRNGMNGFLVKTPQEMADLIVKIQQDRDLHFLLQEYAWRTSRAYMPQVMGDKLIDLYLSLL